MKGDKIFSSPSLTAIVVENFPAAIEEEEEDDGGGGGDDDNGIGRTHLEKRLN